MSLVSPPAATDTAYGNIEARGLMEGSFAFLIWEITELMTVCNSTLIGG